MLNWYQVFSSADEHMKQHIDLEWAYSPTEQLLKMLNTYSRVELNSSSGIKAEQTRLREFNKNKKHNKVQVSFLGLEEVTNPPRF